MLAGAAVTVVNFLICAAARTRFLQYAQRHPFALAGIDDKTKAGQIAVYALLPYLLGFFGWVITAVAAFRGRPGTPVLAGVLFGLGTLATVLILLRVHVSQRADMLAIAIWVLGLFAMIVLSSRNSRAFFQRR